MTNALTMDDLTVKFARDRGSARAMTIWQTPEGNLYRVRQASTARPMGLGDDAYAVSTLVSTGWITLIEYVHADGIGSVHEAMRRWLDVQNVHDDDAERED